jgi:hypothetical protein
MLLISLLILWIVVIPALVVSVVGFAAWRRELPRSPARVSSPRGRGYAAPGKA